MSYSILPTIRALGTSLLAPEHGLSCSTQLWCEGVGELRRRGRGERESGAFLLGHRTAVGGRTRRCVARFVYYDDLDPHCLETGIVVFDGAGYGPLWALCRESGLTVVADVHTHPGVARQSDADRRHPMIAKAGHVAVIVPDYAQRETRGPQIGVYEYEGAHRWLDYSGPAAERFLYIGAWA
jgi:proteasome lid subunit RPN8/RPN11